MVVAAELTNAEKLKEILWHSSLIEEEFAAPRGKLIRENLRMFGEEVLGLDFVPYTERILLAIEQDKQTSIISLTNLTREIENMMTEAKTVKTNEVDLKSLMTISAFAKQIGVTRETVWRWHKQGKVLPVYIGENGYRYYSEEEVKLVQETMFAEGQELYDQENLRGLYSIGEFSEAVGLSIGTLRNWHKSGKLIPAYVGLAGRRYYNEEQREELVQQQMKRVATKWTEGVIAQRKKGEATLPNKVKEEKPYAITIFMTGISHGEEQQIEVELRHEAHDRLKEIMMNKVPQLITLFDEGETIELSLCSFIYKDGRDRYFDEEYVELVNNMHEYHLQLNAEIQNN